jgi:hypothetical protein
MHMYRPIDIIFHMITYSPTHWIKPQGQTKSLRYRQVHNQNLNLRICKVQTGPIRILRCKQVQNGFLRSWIATSSANLGLVGASGYVSQLKFASKSSSILRQFDRWFPIAMAFHIARRCNAEMKAQRSIQDADLAYLGEEIMQGLHWGCVRQS